MVSTAFKIEMALFEKLTPKPSQTDDKCDGTNTKLLSALPVSLKAKGV